MEMKGGVWVRVQSQGPGEKSGIRVGVKVLDKIQISKVEVSVEGHDGIQSRVWGSKIKVKVGGRVAVPDGV